MNCAPAGTRTRKWHFAKVPVIQLLHGGKKSGASIHPSLEKIPCRSAAPFPITDIPVIEGTFAGDNIMRKLDFVNEKRDKG